MSKQDLFNSFITKRIYNFNYLARAHGSEGEAAPHWLNIMKLNEDDLSKEKGAEHWIPLCISIGNILHYNVDIFLQHLIAIFEFFTAEKRFNSADKIVKHMEQKVNNYQDCPIAELSLPFKLSKTETLFTLCDVMCNVYEKLGTASNEQINDSSFRNDVERVDSLIKNLLLVKLCNNMNNFCSSKAQQIMFSIDSLYALNKLRHF